jgi:hypothetical protein
MPIPRDTKTCESCDYPATELRVYQMTRYFGRPDMPQHRLLCKLCAATMAGTASEYPEQFHTAHENYILQTICYVGNTILDAIMGRTDAT